MSKTRHPDSARLLAWLDHELNPFRSWQVGRHVERCWQCRARVTELEASISAVGQVLEPFAVESVDLAKARWRFREAAAQVEESVSTGRRRPGLVFCMAGAAAAALCIGVIALRPPPVPVAAQPTAAALLDTAISAESPAARAAIREEQFSVEYRSGGQAPVRRELRVLSSPARGAWTARWSTEDGALQSAVFAGSAQEFTQTTGLRPVVFRKSAGYKGLFDHASSGGQDLEKMILGWIRDQVWQPVSLAREVQEFCTRSGAVLKISMDGTAVLWSAESTLDRARFEVYLQGSRGQAPGVLRVVWQSARGSGSIQVKRESRREYDDERLAAALLYPHAGSRRQAAIEDAPPLWEVVRSAETGPSLRDLLAAEVAVLHALHRGNLCKADEVRVVRVADAIQVSGGFGSEEQAERIAALLSGIPLLRVRLHTVELPPAPVLQMLGAPAERHASPPAVEPWLRSRLGVGVRASEREMFNTMNAVVRDSEDLLSDSWALFKLSKRFPVELESEMDSETRAKVTGMADDHIVRMSVHLAAIDGRLALQHTAQPVPQATTAWQNDSNALHEHSKKTAELLLNLFASGDLSRTSSASNPEDAGVAALIGRVRSMATQVRAQLSAELRPTARQ